MRASTRAVAQSATNPRRRFAPRPPLHNGDDGVDRRRWRRRRLPPLPAECVDTGGAKRSDYIKARPRPPSKRPKSPAKAKAKRAGAEEDRAAAAALASSSKARRKAAATAGQAAAAAQAAAATRALPAMTPPGAPQKPPIVDFFVTAFLPDGSDQVAEKPLLDIYADVRRSYINQIAFLMSIEKYT